MAKFETCNRSSKIKWMWIKFRKALLQVCSTTSSKFVCIWINYSSFWDIRRHYRPVGVRLNFSGGRGGDTLELAPLSPMNNFCLYPPPVLRCFWKDPLMTPHHPTSSIFHCYPLPIHHPFSPNKNFDVTLAC